MSRDTFAQCVDCGHQLRPVGMTRDLAPDTYAQFPGPRCPGCYKTGPRRERTDECVGCGKPFRGHKERAADHPGTCRRATGTQCGVCWDKARKEAGILPKRRATTDEPLEVVEPDPGLVAYLRNRRRRGVPAEGIRSDLKESAA